MAGVEEDEVEYESDPDEAKQSLTMRRRVASDDEEEEEGEREERRDKAPRRIDSDVESDGQGAAAEYDEDEELEEEYVEEEYEEEVEEEEEYDARRVEDSGLDAEAVLEVAAGAVAVAVAVAEDAVVNELDVGMGRGSAESLPEVDGANQVEGEEEKKENEPFAVPTAGAFYMHDDRFRNNAGGRHRRTLGGRKLWESKDENKWGHDKFEEMSLQERHHEEGRRNSRGRNRSRGRKKNADQGYQNGNRTKGYNNSNQSHAPKSVRGRGPRRYEQASRISSETPSTHNKQSVKPVEETSHPNSGRSPVPISSNEPGAIHARKHASSLNYASPPFYPSGSSNQEVTLTHKRDSEAKSVNPNLRSVIMDENFSMSQSNAIMRGKDVADSARMDKSRASGRGLAPSGQMNFQPITPHNQVRRVSPPTQHSNVQRNPVQFRLPTVQASAQHLGQRPSSGPQASSPPKSASSIKSFETGETESSIELSKSKAALSGKVKDSVQGFGMGSFLYNGAQIMGPAGNMGGSKGDQSFPSSPAFLPVMPFGGQHPGGIGVPAIGMAFPGYVGQNSEMTWLPVLAGAAGALGASYGSPYITVDGAYHVRPSGQASALGASSKETTSKPTDESKPPQRAEPTGDEFGQRHNHARRYSKMNFSQ